MFHLLPFMQALFQCSDISLNGYRGSAVNESTQDAPVAGQHVRVVAPAYRLDSALIDQGVAAVQALGFTVSVDPRCYESYGKLAGDDACRAAALMAAFADPQVDVILTLRGGYGCTRLLPYLDYAGIAAHPKPLIGYSDVTALLLALQPLIGRQAIHGPCLESFARGLHAQDTAALLALLAGDNNTYNTLLNRVVADCRRVRNGTASGPLIGGNLSLLASLIGTAQDYTTAGCWLFLEDWQEPHYRIDRLITQLQASGRLSAIAGLIIGDFQRISRIGEDLPLSLEQGLLAQLPDSIPVLADFPLGHAGRQWPLPLGVPLYLDAQGVYCRWTT